MIVMENNQFKQTAFGDIPSDWTISSIENIASQEKGSLAMGPFGSNITKDNFRPAGVPVIRGNNLTEYRFHDSDFVFLSEDKADELRSSNVKPEDLVITHRGTLGQVGIISTNSRYKRYVISQSGMKLTCDKKKVNPQFVFYWLKSPKGQQELLRNTSQTGVPAIAQPLSSLRKVKLPLPSLTEQKAIAAFLSNFDERLDLNKKMNRTLEAVGAALFKRWFVDFEFPDQEGKPYKTTGGEMVYDTEIQREKPKEWDTKKIDEIPIIVTDFVANGSFASLRENVSIVENEDFALFVRNVDLKNDFSSKRYVTKKAYKFLAKSDLHGGEVIISSVGDVGSVYLCPSFERPMTLGNNMIMIKSKNGLDYNPYLYLHFKSEIGQQQMRSITTGSVQMKFNKTDFRNLPIAIPDKKNLGIIQ